MEFLFSAMSDKSFQIIIQFFPTPLTSLLNF